VLDLRVSVATRGPREPRLADLANDAPSVAKHGIERNDGGSLRGVDELV
jgi:hypothetical protein